MKYSYYTADFYSHDKRQMYVFADSPPCATELHRNVSRNKTREEK